MKRLVAPFAIVLLPWFASTTAAGEPPAAKKPNILFIAIDDLRDWVGYLGHQQARTPHLDRLSARGVAFTRGYCASPCCNPSRTALLSGLRPGASGVYNNNDDWRQIIPAEIPTLPLHFKNHGYYVAGAGKIYHGGLNRLSDWDDYLTKAEVQAAGRGKVGGKNGGKDGGKDGGKVGGKGQGKKYQEDVGGVGGIRFGALDCDDQEMPDYKSVSYCLNQLRKPHDQPFFLACGLFKPHMAWSVPKKYYQLYPLENIQLPTCRPLALKWPGRTATMPPS
jgi:arylsulfatase A-like enzyme